MRQIHAFLGHSISEQPSLFQTCKKTKKGISCLELEATPWEKSLYGRGVLGGVRTSSSCLPQLLTYQPSHLSTEHMSKDLLLSSYMKEWVLSIFSPCDTLEFSVGHEKY